MALGDLEYGDFSLLGKGVDGEPITVGFERKKIHDMINSMSSGRLQAHQLPGLISSYKVVNVILEGLWRGNPHTGIIETPKGGKWLPLSHGKRRFLFKEVVGFLATITYVVGVRVWRTANEGETVQLLTTLAHWWTSKDFNEHRSHLSLRTEIADTAQLTQPGLVQRVAATLPGIGMRRSREVAKRFGSVMDLVMADAGEWEAIPGVGKGIAKKVREAITGRVE